MGKHKGKLFNGFALNALTQTERDQMLQYEANASTVGQELASLQQTAAYLGLTVSEAKPPPRIMTYVMEAIRTVEQVPASVDATQCDHSATEARALLYPHDELARSMQSVHRKPRKPFALSAGILLVASGALGALAWNLNTQQQMEMVVQTMKSEQGTMKQILSAQDMQSKSQTLDNGATIRLSYSEKSGVMAVSTHALPELPETKGYELWLISAEKAIPAGMLDPSSTAAAAMINGSLEGITPFGITVEPAAGSPAPTTEPILLQSL